MIITVTVLLILLCGSIGLSQRALVGGSPIINFIFMLLLAAPTPYIIVGSLKSTMPVLYLILMGSSLVGFTRHYRTKSQETGKYLMDYDLVMITLPVAASGALFGVHSIKLSGTHEELAVIVTPLGCGHDSQYLPQL